MEKKYNNYWVIQNLNGNILPYTLDVTRKECIKNFVDGGEMTWQELSKKYDWRCVKVDVIFKLKEAEK